jgi:hypothetical protein
MAKDSKHATTGSGGGYCCSCSSSVGAPVKVQPTNHNGSVYCPRCWVWKNPEPETFNPMHSCVTRCQFCDWITVCYGALPGMGLRCSHCGQPGALRLKLTEEDLEGIQEAVRDAQNEAKKVLESGKPSVPPVASKP